MVAVSEALVAVVSDVDPPLAVRERLEAFGVEVLAEAMNRRVQESLTGGQWAWVLGLSLIAPALVWVDKTVQLRRQRGAAA